MSNHENSSSNSNGTASNVQIKTEPGLPNAARLSSFKPPRDLTLGANKSVSKKVFTPNLNVVRNRNKNVNTGELTSSRDDSRKRGRGGNSGPRGGRGAAALRDSRIIKAEGVFSEGIATPARHGSSRASYGGSSRNSNESAGLVKPTIRHKSEWKIDKESEDLQIAELMHDEQDEDPLNDGNFNPIRLPINAARSLTLKKEDSIDISETIKEETIEKSETNDCSIKEEPPETANYSKIKKEPSSSNATDLLQNPKPTLILLQFPDCLPGRGPDVDSNKKDTQNISNATTEQPQPKRVSEESKFFTSKNLEEGQVGKIVIYKSGKIKLQMDDTFYDLSLGTQPCFEQGVMSISTNPEERSATMINIGSVQNKLTAIPDWERMFSKIFK